MRNERWRICFIADTDIDEDDQILIDYGNQFSERRQIDPEPLRP